MRFEISNIVRVWLFGRQLGDEIVEGVAEIAERVIVGAGDGESFGEVTHESVRKS